MIEENYQINHETMAIVSVMHYEYNTIVYELEREIYVKEPPNTIIRNAFKKTSQSLAATEQYVEKQFNFIQRKPVFFGWNIPYFFFPTTGKRDPHICWLAPRFIESYKSYKENNVTSTEVTFKNKATLTIEGLSKHTMDQQYNRTLDIKKHVLEKILIERENYFAAERVIKPAARMTTYTLEAHSHLPTSYTITP